MPADAETVQRGWWYSWGNLVVFMLAAAVLVAFVFTAPGILASPHPVRSYVLIVGIVAELSGLAMALVGLYKTWHANAPGRSFYPWVARLWSRRAMDTERADSAGAELSVDGIPLAVSGLGVTMLGVLLQALAQGLPS